MSSLKNIFLEQFDDKWRAPLIAFGTRLSESDADADVFIFMARKAACLFHCLEDLRIAHTDAICTSDLALEGDLAWLRNKRVLLIDDTLISGTTLYRAQQRLAEAGAASVSTIVFCVDRENWCRELVNPIEPYILAEPHEVTNFSAQTVRAISIVPRPYLIDFPLFGFVRLRGLSLDPVLSTTDWAIDELTTHSQRDAGATSITMTPPSQVLFALDEHLGWHCSKYAQLVKVRLYTRIRGGRGQTPVHFCRVMPIVAFDPMTRLQLDALWKAFTSNLGERAHSLSSKLQKPKERLRVLQYFCAARLFDIWLAEIRSICAPRLVSFELDFRQVDFAFPPSVRDDLIDILRDTTRYPFGGAPQFIQSNLPARPGLIGITRFKGFDLPGVQAKLTEPFANLFMQRELPARKLVKEHGVRAFELSEYRDLIDRLNQGISLPELREALACFDDVESARLLVSMFMDDAIDRGVAVPITVDDGVFVYRAFRHGEDVRFTEIEARLVCLMLQEFSHTASMPVLPRLVVEKLIVLLIKGGLSRGFIERWTGSLGDRQSAGIRFFRQGAVAQQAPDRRPYHYAPGDSLTSLLKGWGYLSEVKKGNYKQYYVGQLPDRPPTSTKDEKDAKALGATIALSLSGVTAKQRDDELTLIATCLNPMDTAAALAAELHLFETHWNQLSRVLLANPISIEAEEILRKHSIYEAVNSGLWKWRNHHSGTPLQALRNWHERLTSSSSSILADAVLEGAFPVSDATFQNGELNSLIESSGQWLIDTNITLRRLRLELIATSTKAKTADYRQATISLHEQINQIENEKVRESSIDNTPLGIQLDLALPILSKPSDTTVDSIIARLNELVIQARAILDRIDALVTPFGELRQTHHYRHLMTICLDDEGDRLRIFKDRILAETKKLSIDAKKSSSSAELFLLQNASGTWGAEIAVAATGLFGREWLSRAAAKAFQITTGQIKCRVCIWAELEPDEQITRGENSREALARNLQSRVRSFGMSFSRRPAKNEIVVISSRGEQITNAVENEILRNFGSTFRKTSSRIINITDPRQREYLMELHEENQTRAIPRSTADIGIITIVPEEMNAVMDTLKQGSDYKKERKNNSIYYMSHLPADEGGKHYVVATQQLEQGNRSVILAYDRLCREYQPSIIILLGIGGAIDRDIDLCDVVVADQVIWYEQATITDSSVNRKGEASKISAWLRLLLNDFFAQKGYPYLLNRHADSPQSKVFIGPIGTGEKVVRFRDSDIRDWLSTFNYKCMALETEAGGLAQAFYETSATTSYTAKGYLIIRGISDHADKDKNYKWRVISARNACTFLVDFLSTVPPLSNNPIELDQER
jgi:nucleoside phosphorylase